MLYWYPDVWIEKIGVAISMRLSRSKRIFLFVFAGIICFSGIAAYIRHKRVSSLEQKRAVLSKTNIVLISIDTLRADHLGCYGYSRETSSHIDAFAKEAVQFQNAITQAPVTATAHMSIFTALTPMVHRVRNHLKDGSYYQLSKEILTLPEILKKNDYITAGFVGGGNISGNLGFDRGFDSYISDIKWEAVYNEPEQLDRIRHWIKLSAQKDRPLFLFLHNYLCHDPYISAPKEFRLRFLDEPVDGLPLGPDDIEAGKSSEINGKGIWENVDLRNPNHMTGFIQKREKFWKNVDLSKPEHRRHIVSLYDGCVSYADYVFGQTINLLKEENIFENSIIILLSDHGEEFYEHQTRLHKHLFIETMHVPLIIRFPNGKFGGVIVKDYVRTMDLMPTILEFLGIETHHFIQGVSFLPSLTHQGKYDPVMLGYDEDISSMRFQNKDFVYTNIRTPEGNEWLFDIATDPNELNNLADSRHRILVEMRKMSEDLRNRDIRIWEKNNFEIDRPLKADEKILRQLKALGYIE